MRRARNWLDRSVCATLVLAFGHSMLGFAGTRPQTARPDAVQPKFALLVGVTNYKNPKINKIDGCENNVPLLAETLVKNYAFEQKDLLSLLNQDATKANILANFRSHLIENARRAKAAGKEAVVVFYFCGHGSQYTDQDKDENDELDETFVAYDSRSGDVFDILDDEIDDLKAELRPFTSNTTLILESCHSGTGSREGKIDPELITEEIDGDKRPRPAYKRRFAPTRDEEALTYTEIAASLSINTAKSESKQFCNCEKPYSLMTKALVEALNRASHTTTYRNLVREVAIAVSERSRQEPQVEGNRDALIFGGAARRAKPYIEIERLLPGNRLVIRAGRVHGLKAGSQIAVFSSRSTTHAGIDGWLANGIATEIGDFQSVVQLHDARENSKISEIKVTSHAVLTSPVFGGGPIFVVLRENDRDPTSEEAVLVRDIETGLESYGLIENQIVKLGDLPDPGTSGDKPRAVIRLKRDTVRNAFADTRMMSLGGPARSCEGNVLKMNAPVPPPPDSEVYYLDDGSPGGAPLFGKFFAVGKSGVASEIAQAIRNFAYRWNLQALDNAASTLPSQVAITISEADIETACSDGRLINRKSSAPGVQKRLDAAVPVDTYFAIRIKNVSGEANRRRTKDKFAAGEPLYVTLVSLSNNGDIRVVYPRLGANDPLADGREIERHFYSTRPLGMERFVVLVTKQPVDLSFLEFSGSARSARSPLESVLVRSGIRSRDSGTVIPEAPDQWGVVHLDLNVVEK